LSDEAKPIGRLAPQQRVGSFILLERLGAGGIGEVWKARDHRLNRVVALKFILEDSHRSSNDLIREARAASALNHPNIVTILEIGESDGGTYIAMEFVEGETLRARMDKLGVSFPTAFDIAMQMAKGLAAAHDIGIVHRDIKPENVMIRIDGLVKLLDFGFAKVLPWSQDAVTAGASGGPSESGQLTGTFGYMSPEQARGQSIEPSSDIFSFGIVLYEMLTGQHPFRADTPIDTLHRIINTEPASTRVRCPELPAEIHNIVERCLKKDKAQRFQSAGDLEAHLRQSQGAQPAPKRVSRRGQRIVGTLVLAIVLAALIWFWKPFARPAANSVVIRSIAVMNLTTPPAESIAGALAQGLSEELGGALARQGFLVPARSRVLAIPGTTDPQSIGAQLKVDGVLQGSVTNDNKTFRIYVELVDAKTGFQIWSRLSNASERDALSSDATTAEEIAKELRSEFGGER
jgi:eukaryotic-like serine/threonine-protein kinase